MFIGLTPCALSKQDYQSSPSGNPSTALVNYTTNGDYPTDTTTNDVIIVSLIAQGFVSTPANWTLVGSGDVTAEPGWLYYSFRRTASAPLSGATPFTGNEFMLTITLRGVSVANLQSAFNEAASWTSLSTLQNNSNIYAVGYSDTNGNHGGATFPGTFTVQTNASKNVLATLTNKNSGTTFAYTGCSNNGTAVSMCFSYGIA